MGVPVKILCIFMLLLHNSVQSVLNDEATLDLPENYEIGWMESLNDDKFISEVTIPGTHDTMALHAGAPAECQSWSLENQLLAGIRYLDLRVKGKNLKLVHGVISQHTTFSDAIDTIKIFLAQYKTEAVLVRVKHESKGPFPDDVANDLKNDSSCWVSDKIPRIKDVRGKIVFVQKNNFELGIPLLETDEKDDYKVGNVGVTEAEITEHLNEDVKDCKADIVVLNYSSGKGWPQLRLDKAPRSLDKEENFWLYSRSLSPPDSNPCFGIIAMNCPSFALIQRIIGFNY
ncbi:1-phosphatidylinositol phosphodiesterase [Danio aesculapii]|uniref:1-phosphatidylinositol phosphodiesterase n=1 Tax=Danio aesculapii TaxID=1142201 RepID=UPI0024C04116|nr:1-phosphatidylinositol phosphodiesterase [Danio aesculapii]